MRQRAFAEEILQEAKKRDVQAEVFFCNANSFTASASEGELERYAVSRVGGFSLRVNVDGRSGYAYTECCMDAQTLVARAIDNALSIEGSDEHPMQERCSYSNLVPVDSPFAELSHGDKIALALDLEKKALAFDSRVKRLVYCDIGEVTGQVMILNSLGLEAHRKSVLSYIYALPVVEDAGETRTGFDCKLLHEATKVDACAEEAVTAALGKLGGTPVPSDNYRLVLKNSAMAELLAAFSPMFSADEAQRGCSLLADKEGQRIGADCVTIIDDPFHEFAPRVFDDEGTPCITKNVVSKGILKTLLHNLKTAKKAGVQSTGNASRSSAASSIKVAPSVLYIKEGELSAEAILKEMDNGLYITELEGLHAGLSTVSGDFSLQACGRLVENGRLTRAVSDITIAGNFLTMLQNVEAVANDTKFAFPEEVSSASPSVLVSMLAVAGE